MLAALAWCQCSVPGSGGDEGCEGESDDRAGIRGKAVGGRWRALVNRWRVGVWRSEKLRGLDARALARAAGERVLGAALRRRLAQLKPDPLVAEDLVETGDDLLYFFRREAPKASTETVSGERPDLADFDPGALR